MTTYSGRHKDDDRLSTKWKIKKSTHRKPDSVISESGYSSSNGSNSSDSFHLIDQTTSSTSRFLCSPSIQDTDSDDVVEKNTEFKTTLPEKANNEDENENDSITTLEVKQLESNNCVKLGTAEQSTSKQSSTKQPSTKQHLNVQTSAPIKLNKHSSGEDEQRKQRRFNRTAKALRDSGLLPIAIQTGHLLKKHLFLQKEIDKLKKEAALFLQSLDSEENMSENTASNSSSFD